MIENKTRKAKITKYEDGSGGFVVDAIFHGWGTKKVSANDGNDFPITVGVVEVDGKIDMVDPRRIHLL